MSRERVLKRLRRLVLTTWLRGRSNSLVDDMQMQHELASLHREQRQRRCDRKRLSRGVAANVQDGARSFHYDKGTETIVICCANSEYCCHSFSSSSHLAGIFKRGECSAAGVCSAEAKLVMKYLWCYLCATDIELSASYQPCCVLPRSANLEPWL